MSDSFRTIRNILQTQFVQDYLESVFNSAYLQVENLARVHQPVYSLNVSDQFKVYEALLAISVWMSRHPQTDINDGIVLRFPTADVLISRGKVNWYEDGYPILESQPGHLLVYDFSVGRHWITLTKYTENYFQVFPQGQDTRVTCNALGATLRKNLNEVFVPNENNASITRAQLVLLTQLLVAENFERPEQASTRTMGSSFLFTQFLHFGIGNEIEFDHFKVFCLFATSSSGMHNLRSGTQSRRLVTDEAQEFLQILEELAQSEEAQSEENFGRDLLRAMYCIVENNIAMP